MKYLSLIWNIIFWSAVWAIGLGIFFMIITPDMTVGFVVGVFFSPLFGAGTALIKFFREKKALKLKSL
jgi:hypothetical protein